ncbi:MAG: ATP-binding cassette domain-containing protein [Streptococcaceae bacterium]|jgi:ABC-2 type transport system ATP-binding protein|nr:ATP-binding cassette domain-containing protein [Streptococcaceae bacterium]
MTAVYVENLTTDIFQNVSFDLPNHGFYGLIGRNGIGKSTLFSILNGEVKNFTGTFKIGKVCYVPSLEIFDKYLSANDYIALLSQNEQIAFDKHLEFMGGADFFSKKIGTYSLGMKELFAFIFAVSLDSEVLILDALLDGLDEQRRFKALRLVKQYSHDRLVLLTSHNLSEVFEYSDAVYFLDRDSLEKVDNLSLATERISVV